MKDIYVNKEGVICACTVEVPERPMKGHYWNAGSREAEDKLTENYQQALQACKESAVPFEDQGKALMLLYRETKTDYKINASYGEWANNYLKEDTFYQIEADWQIMFYSCNDKLKLNELPCPESAAEFPDCCGSKKKVARLKVPAPTVATDNSGGAVNREDILGHPDRNWTEDLPHENGNYICRCIYCKQPFQGHKRRVVCKKCSVASPVEEEQDQFLLHLVDVVACFTSEQNQYYATSVRMDLIKKARETFKPKDSAHPPTTG